MKKFIDSIFETEHNQENGQNKKTALLYWKNLLADYEERAEIPHYESIPETKQNADNKMTAVLSSSLVNKLRELCRQQQVMLLNGLELAWAMVLNTYTRLEDLIFAESVHVQNTSAAQVNGTAETIRSIFLVRVKLDSTITAEQLLKNLSLQSQESIRNGNISFEDIFNQHSLGKNIYQSLLAFYCDSTEKTKEVNTQEHKQYRTERKADIELNVNRKDNEELELSLNYNNALYSSETVQQIMKTYQVFIQGITAQPTLPLSKLPRMSEEDILRIMELSCGEDLPYDKTKTWVDMFHKQAQIQPDHIAVVDSVSSITYSEMDQQSNAIAHYLIQQGVKKNDFVAIRMDRVKEFPVAVLGVNKAGAAYVPVDPDYPDDRIKYMLEDSQARIVLTEALFADIFKEYQNPGYINYAVPDTLAYMIYTSGSTGKPKGVMIAQHALRNLIEWNNLHLHQSSETAHLIHSSFNFDASISDLICPLQAGATVCIADKILQHDLGLLADYINQNNVAGLDISTQIGMELINNYSLNLKYIMLGGEKLLPVQACSYSVYNVYGPTEFTVTSSIYKVLFNEKDIPIGRPVPNTSSFICDSCGNLLPQGAAGELCLFGVQMAEGYWNNSEKTKAAFVDCPFKPGEKMYRTGDLCRYNEDGNLIYLGRLDRQVKLRGFRIELGEIENRTSQFNALEKIAAEVRKEQLCLYYTSSAQIDKKELKAFLTQTLPEYMVPAVYMQLDAMPMNPSGKIDRKKLPDPVIISQIEYVPPRTELEKKICCSLAVVLNIPEEKIGIDDDFFALGGNSITSMKLISQLKLPNLSIMIINRGKTVRRIAELYNEEFSQQTQVSRAELNQIALTEEVPLQGTQISFIDYQLYTPKSTFFDMVNLFELDDSIDMDRFIQAVNSLLQHHPLLSSRIIFNSELDICLKYTPVLYVPVLCETISEKQFSELIEKLISPMQLFNSKLYQCKIIKTETHCYFYFNVHHSISDGTSLALFMDNLKRLYIGEELQPDHIYLSLKEQSHIPGKNFYSECKSYFEERYNNKEWTVLPYFDHESSEIELGTLLKSIPIPDKKCSALFKRHTITGNLFFLTVMLLTLAKVTKKRNIFTASYYNGRDNEEKLNMFGNLLKEIPIGLVLEDTMPIQKLLGIVKELYTEGIIRSCYTYTRDNERIGINERMSFIYQLNMYNKDYAADTVLPMKSMKLAHNNTAFAKILHIELIDNDGDRYLHLLYMSTLYERKTMENFAREYIGIASKIVDTMDQNITVKEILLQS